MDREFEKEVIERLIRIETKMSDYETTKTTSQEARAKAYENERRINELEDKIKWLVRTTIGALITGGIGLVYAFLKLGLKI